MNSLLYYLYRYVCYRSMFIPWYVPGWLETRYCEFLFKMQWSMEDKQWIRERVPQALVTHLLRKELTNRVTKVFINDETVTFH